MLHKDMSDVFYPLRTQCTTSYVSYTEDMKPFAFVYAFLVFNCGTFSQGFVSLF